MKIKIRFQQDFVVKFNFAVIISVHSTPLREKERIREAQKLTDPEHCYLHSLVGVLQIEKLIEKDLMRFHRYGTENRSPHLFQKN